MKKTKVVLCVLVLCAMVIGQLLVLTACKEETYDANNFIADTSSAKIVKEKITLNLFVPRSQQHLQDWNKMRLFKELEEETNIAIKFSYGDVSSYESQKSNAWASRHKPDAFFLWNKISDQITESKLGTIRPIDDLIDSYAPNYKALLDADPEIKKTAQLLDGKMYSTVTINTVPRDWTFKQYINIDWIYQALVNEVLQLSDLGLTSMPNINNAEEKNLLLPNTTEEFYKVLKAFKDMGKTPLSSIGYSNNLRSFLMSAFGYVTTGVALDKNDSVMFVQETDNYREYLKFARRLFSDGLIDNTIFTNTTESAFFAKADSLGSFDSSSAYLVVGKNKDSQYTALPPLTSSINSAKMWLDYDNKYDATTLMIPTTTPYYREIMRWIDRLYSPKYIEMQAFGKENEDWTWDNAEKSSFTFNVPEGQSIERFRGTLTPSVGLGQITYWDGQFVLKENNLVTQKINAETQVYLEYMTKSFPKVKFTSQETDTLALITTGLNSVTTDFEKLVINGDKEHDINNDSVWEQFKQSLIRAGLENYKTIYQTAYNRYKA
ncbi:MAG: hypothetical protein RR291_00090 [Clostridia bacterium]